MTASRCVAGLGCVPASTMPITDPDPKHDMMMP